MKRWLRTIFRIIGAGAIVLSALLCAASLGMWVRSYFVRETMNYYSRISAQGERSIRRVVSDEGVLSASMETYIVAPGQLFVLSGWVYGTIVSSSKPSSLPLYARLGFHYSSRKTLAGATYHGASVPYWFLTTIFATTPLIWFIRRRRRIPAGHCQACGYDLRETPQRCPECGTNAEAAE